MVDAERIQRAHDMEKRAVGFGKNHQINADQNEFKVVRPLKETPKMKVIAKRQRERLNHEKKLDDCIRRCENFHFEHQFDDEFTK